MSSDAGLEVDPLEAPDAGGRVIRGGAVRVLGYVGGVGVYLATAPFLFRHLGVDDLGGYVSVLALIGVVALISDAGLTLVGIREYAARDRAGRERLLSNLLTLRTLVVVFGVLLACLFALVANYPGRLVTGTALAGVGLVLLVVQQTYAIELTAQLRAGTVTLLEVGRQVLNAAAILTLIGLGADVTLLLAASIVASGLIALVLYVRGPAIVPRCDLAEARYLAGEAVSVAVASTVGALFYRSAIVVMSITATDTQTSYFAASYRILESAMAVPSLLCATIFPILSRAAADDRDRSSFALRRMAEVGLMIGAFMAVTLALAAGPAMALLGGSRFEESVGVLRIQAAALPATFLVSVWATGLWAVRAHRGLFVANVIGVTLAVTLSALAGSAGGARLVAIGMLVAESTLALLYYRALAREQADLRPGPMVVLKVVIASGLGAAAAFVPVPALVQAIIGGGVFGLALIGTRAIPADVWQAFSRFRQVRLTEA